MDGVTRDPGKIRAMQEMLAPTDVEGVKRVMGMADYLNTFLPHLASYTRPIKTCSVERTSGAGKCWLPIHQQRKTCVSADASSFGLGGCPNPTAARDMQTHRVYLKRTVGH